MKLITSFFILILFFHESLSYSQYLEKHYFTGTFNLNISSNNNSEIKFNLVEIFNPFEKFYYKKGYRLSPPLNRAVFMFKNDNKTNVIGLFTMQLRQEIWLRVINVRDLIPQGSSNNPDLTIIANSVSVALTIDSTGVLHNDNRNILYNEEIMYNVYTVPIYPSGNINTWSDDYKTISLNKRSIVFNAINNSIEEKYLNKAGVLLHTKDKVIGSVTFTIANRINRDFLLIIVAKGPNGDSIQYPPVYISGCLTVPGKEKTCRLFDLYYPMNIVFGCSILFFLFAIKYDLIQVFFCSMISSCVIALFIWRLISDDVFTQDSSMFWIFLGIAPISGFFCLFNWGIFATKYLRTRMIFTSLVITLIMLSILWFTPIRSVLSNGLMYFTIISTFGALILFSIFCFCNHLTLTVGSVFISAVAMSLSISINYLNGSIIPFIFIDFFNSIVYSYPDWIYYSPLLNDDRIIVIVCPILSLFVGLCFYALFKRILSKKNVVAEQPKLIRQPVKSCVIYGSNGNTQPMVQREATYEVHYQQNVQAVMKRGNVQAVIQRDTTCSRDVNGTVTNIATQREVLIRRPNHVSYAKTEVIAIRSVT